MAENENEEPENPFKGTPMEQLFGAFSGGQMDMNQIMGQMQKMFAPHEGSVNFDLAKDVARHTVAAAGTDPSPNSAQQGAVDDAAQLAESWLDTVTSFPVGATTATAWSKAEWIEATSGTWQQLVEPIAAHVVKAMGEALPEEAKAMAGPLMGMLSQAGGAMFGQQVGQALGGLAGEVVSSTDIGIPLGPERIAAVLPSGVEAFGEGLEHPASDVLLYIVLRECAHHRLFHHSPWLRPALVGAIEEFGRGTRIDVGAIESQLQGLDPSRPEELQQALAGGLFEPERTPDQQRALDRLETLLAFIEGWVDEIVSQATKDRMPAAAPARRGDASSPRGRRSRRADVRVAGRPRAATPQAPRGDDPVGGAPRPSGTRRPRRRVEPPRPHAVGGRPRGPARLRAGRAPYAERRRLRRRTRRAARQRPGRRRARQRFRRPSRVTLRDDARGVLSGWTAPDDEQDRLRQLYVAHTETYADAMRRECHPDHLTASAIIFSADHQRVLLTLHRIIKRWLQTGGHCEPDDATLAEAALREGREESGIGDLVIDPVPVLLSRHEVPCGPIRPAHHLDVQYVAVAPAGAQHVISDESDDLAWFDVDALPAETDDSVRALTAAARTRLRGTP